MNDKYNMIDTDKVKIYDSVDYNYIFDKTTGLFMRWGKTKSDDSECAPSPEIADIEISTICNKNCPACYKANTSKGMNMSLKTFKMVFTNLPNTLTQIAFGIGSIDANPDLEAILKYTRLQGVIPNITINGERMNDKWYDMLAETCGAVAVSMYDYNKCVTALKELNKRGMKQTNIHMIAAEETFTQCIDLISNLKRKGDDKYVNAIVFLCLKPVGRGINMHPMPKDLFARIVKHANKHNMTIGFDSCSAPLIYDCYDERIQQMIEPCESTLFSIYINAEGEAFPCSFIEQAWKGKNGIDVTKPLNFVNDVWFSETFKMFRNKLMNNKDCDGCRKCPEFKLYD